MARIRSIKPEFCTSEQVAECSTTSRLLFVLMWMFCDDAGRHPASTRRLKMECFPADDITQEEIEACVNELHTAGLLVEFEYEGKRYWQVTGWKHQRIDKPCVKYGPKKDEKTALPIDQYVVKFDNRSTTILRPVSEYYANGIGTLADSSPADGSGEERRGEEGIQSGFDDSSTNPTAAPKKQSSVQTNPPSVEEVRTYMFYVNKDPKEAEAFIDFYTANGWVQGRGKPIKDWQAAVRNWFRNEQFRTVTAGSKVAGGDDLRDWSST